jgi:biotin-dependent carboxylase-like uncharacterized protein
MRHAIEIVEPGAANTVQDRGRRGFRRFGVPVSGAADPLLLAAANRLLGNPDDDAAIEMPLAGPRLRATEGPVRVALMAASAGALAARVIHADASTAPLPVAQTATLRRGDALAVGPVREGVAYLAVSGGCRVPPQLGSRSTYARARLGGVAGRALAAGDLIECGEPSGNPSLERRASAPFVHADGPLRVLPGPQDDAFEPAALAALLAEPWVVGRDSDRMGLRLQGPRLAHRHGADIVSDGVVPGAIQVPGDGQPIVLLADAQTVGGYTKIATVIRADLPRLAHLRPGTTLRFTAVSRAQALAALREQALALERWTSALGTFLPAGIIDPEALATGNLVSGVIDAGGEILPWEDER